MMLLKRKTSAETLKLQGKYGVPYLVFPVWRIQGWYAMHFYPSGEAAGTGRSGNHELKLHPEEMIRKM